MKNFLFGERFSFVGTLAFGVAFSWGGRDDVDIVGSLLAFTAAMAINALSVWFGKK